MGIVTRWLAIAGCYRKVDMSGEQPYRQCLRMVTMEISESMMPCQTGALAHEGCSGPPPFRTRSRPFPAICAAHGEGQGRECLIERISSKIKRGPGVLCVRVAERREGRSTAKKRGHAKGAAPRGTAPVLMCELDQAARLFQTLSAVIAFGAVAAGRKRSDDTLKNLRSQPFKAPSSRSRA